MKDKQMFMEEFNNKLHRLGRITLVLSVVFLVALPFVFGAFFGVSPDMGGFLSGFAKVGVIYIPVAIVEFLVYTPMLGVGGSYLSFITNVVTIALVATLIVEIISCSGVPSVVPAISLEFITQGIFILVTFPVMKER